MKNLEKFKGESAIMDIVVDHVKENGEEYLEDVVHHGCASGACADLVYYKDTHAFFDKYYDEIEEMRVDYEVEMGEPVNVSGDLKNHMAWFAYESKAHELYNRLEDE